MIATGNVPGMGRASDAGRVLLVDDDPSVLRATAGVLQHHGFAVECHAKPESALESVSRGEVDVLITDLHLPGQSGLDLLRSAQARASLAAILITGQPDVRSAIDAIRLAAVDYLVKPFDPLELVETVRSAVEKARAMRRVSDVQREVAAMAGMLGDLRAVLDTPGAVRAPTASATPRPTPMRGLTAEERERLSSRELEVIAQMVEGKSPKEIASQLFISPHTVRNHLRSIYSKLGVHTQVELVRKVVA